MVDRIWEIRNPDGASLGLEVARGRSASHHVILAHAMPDRIDVFVSDPDGEVVASATGLSHPASTPISRLTLVGDRVTRDNIWPADDDLGLPVILPGGEIGILTAWWNADDRSEWRWSIELHNHA